MHVFYEKDRGKAKAGQPQLNKLGVNFSTTPIKCFVLSAISKSSPSSKFINSARKTGFSEVIRKEPNNTKSSSFHAM